MPLPLSSRKAVELLETYRPLTVADQFRQTLLFRLDRGLDIFPSIQGRQPVKDDVVRTLLSGAHPYLISEEGTGKTRLGRSIARLLMPVPRIVGCSCNDDPTWPKSRLCPRCGASSDPVKEFGIEWIKGEERFSRIQGNEYTNEAKIIGLKDIQAIASGVSPSDPLSFTGTGVFRANRGVLFIDELPAIRTKVQVLLHPVLQEKRAVLEEYGWQYPLDLCLLATGNPDGFSHVNEVPRPLLDRLETIYMDLPDEATELGILLDRRSAAGKRRRQDEDDMASLSFLSQGIERRPFVPWWAFALVNKAVRQSRRCRWLDRSASIRGTVRAGDHALSSAEMRRARSVGLKDIADGLKLALRGRVSLRQDFVDFENAGETFRKIDDVSEDLLFVALGELSEQMEALWPRDRITEDLKAVAVLGKDRWPFHIAERPGVLRDALVILERFGARIVGEAGYNSSVSGSTPGTADEEAQTSVETAIELLLNLTFHGQQDTAWWTTDIYRPRSLSWGE